MQRHYPGVKLLGDKHMAIVALAVCAGRIYAPRAAILAGLVPRPKPDGEVTSEATAPQGPIPLDPTAGLAADPSWFPPPAGSA